LGIGRESGPLGEEMLNLLLTKKFANEVRFEMTGELPDGHDPKLTWLGHVFFLNRHKYYLFINEESLFSVVLPKKDIRTVWEDFRERVGFWMGNCKLTT
jgi:hypothetical protein